MQMKKRQGESRERTFYFLPSLHSKWCSHVHHAPKPNKQLLLRFSCSWWINTRRTGLCLLPSDRCAGWYYFIVWPIHVPADAERAIVRRQKIVPDDCREIRLDCARLGWKFIFDSAQTYTLCWMRINLWAEWQGSATANPNTETARRYKSLLPIVYCELMSLFNKMPLVFGANVRKNTAGCLYLCVYNNLSAGDIICGKNVKQEEKFN